LSKNYRTQYSVDVTAVIPSQNSSRDWIETRNGMLYLYHSCDHAKYDYLTPQGHFAFLFLITIETQPASTGVVALEPFDSRS
jgi:hypothetical protein